LKEPTSGRVAEAFADELPLHFERPSGATSPTVGAKSPTSQISLDRSLDGLTIDSAS
jgi:hypothetical protein